MRALVRLLVLAVVVAAVGAVAVRSLNQPFQGYGPLVTDPGGLLDLPAGFRYKMFSRAGDRLTGKTSVLAKRSSKSRPSIGLVTMRSELFNQRGEAVFELENTVMFLKREAAA